MECNRKKNVSSLYDYLHIHDFQYFYILLYWRNCHGTGKIKVTNFIVQYLQGFINLKKKYANF